MLGKVTETELSESGRLHTAKVAEFLSAITRALKASVLYPPEGSIPQEFKRTCREQLEGALAELEMIDLQINHQEIVFEGEEVSGCVTGEVNLAELLHRDGVRMLRLREGITEDEFERFFTALRAVFADRNGYADIVNLLWEGDFDNIEYEAVDEHTVAEVELCPQDAFEIPEAVYSEAILAEKSIHDETAVEKSPEGGLLDHSSIASDAGGVSLADVIFEKMQRFSREESAGIAALIARDHEITVEFSAIDTLFDIAVAERENAGFLETCDTLDSMFNRLLTVEGFPLMVYMLRKFKNTSASLLESSRQRSERLRKSFHRCGDRIRIAKLTEILNRSESEDMDSIRSYLEELDWSAVSQLLWMLGELKFFPSRKLVCDLLKAKGRKKPEIIAGAIYDMRWYVVRNTAIVLGEIGTDKCIQPLKKASEHEDERVRWEAVSALCKINTDASRDALAGRLSDDSERVRLLSIRHLSERAYEPAYEAIETTVNSRDFEMLPPPEQKELLKALVSTGGDKSFQYLKKLATRRNLLRSGTIKRLKEIAVYALAQLEGEQVDRLLKGWKSKRRGDLRIWASRALTRRQRTRNSGTIL
jgi:hypothetical protein